jgi:glycosyltransferase involved in cell wall biosynthesis
MTYSVSSNSDNTAVAASKVAFKTQKSKTLFCVAHDLPPLTTPTANRTNKLLKQFQKFWQIQALTCTQNGFVSEDISVHFAKSWYPKRLLELIGKFKLEKFLNWFIWPDGQVFWVLPALLKGYKLIKQQKPDAILVFMMPYSSGLVGIGLKWLTGIPLVLNLDDSLSCTDMHPFSVSWLHHHLERWLEDFYVRQSDAIVYVSQFNLELVKKRQPPSQHAKFNLIRYGIDPQDYCTPFSSTTADSSFEIVYIGGMNGWYEFYHRPEEQTLAKKLYRAWLKLGNYERTKIDFRSSSPVFVGKAAQQVNLQNPNWENKINVKVYGNSFPESVVQKALHNQNLTDVVSVTGSVPHSQAIQLARKADLLLLTLPNRQDGSAGGRISCKTYEYLMTDRPILAAVPKGENWDYLKDKPGVWLVEPTDTEAMSRAISEIAAAKFSGSPLTFDRTALQQELSYVNIAEDFLKIFDKMTSNSNSSSIKDEVRISS